MLQNKNAVVIRRRAACYYAEIDGLIIGTIRLVDENSEAELREWHVELFIFDMIPPDGELMQFKIGFNV